ncbi:glucosylglycerate hydrolase [Kribbella solani]|uniref:Mannosylglycerate hydrolase MGH1-like glycoside hydrolase domain-containing protein n=1 Tax=Kribbella solani TaxID=236067 RepID=A0A841E0B7_9ACTN|nr:glycoside hydrolase 100 family protein [Kribbella solani]MBB5980868.1 hypothetical protein [Kribbella solani]
MTVDATLAEGAAQVLRDNDNGVILVAAPSLYPHQWSWDAAFITVGLARVSVPRALAELSWLLGAQWQTGMIPHIVFDAVDGYFPGPERWRTELSPNRPATPPTSGICQPPVHSLALAAIVEAARHGSAADRRAATEFVRDTLDQWLAWHEWLATVRDPDRTGLFEIHHSWESGMDNSPRWDAPYTRVTPGVMAPFVRRDLAHVEDATERPTDLDYRRYIWLVDQMASVRYDDADVQRVIDFRVSDVFSSALLALSSDVLAELADTVGRPDAADRLRVIAKRSRDGVAASVSPATGLARDRDVRTGEWLSTATVGGFAPLLCGGDPGLVSAQRELFLGPEWCGHPELRYAVPPTTSPADAAFHPRRYWRGPQWPVINWLFARAAVERGDDELAGLLRGESLRQLSDGSFSEYYHPLSGAALGSRNQSWTAAVALDWLGRSW